MNLDVFFSHENQSCPPFLTANGNLLNRKKSDLTNILAELREPVEFCGHCDGVVYVGATMIHGMKPHSSKIFETY